MTLVSVLDSISHRFSLRISTFSSFSSLLPNRRTLSSTPLFIVSSAVVGCLLPLLVGNVRVFAQFLLLELTWSWRSLDRVLAQSRGFHSSSRAILFMSARIFFFCAKTRHNCSKKAKKISMPPRTPLSRKRYMHLHGAAVFDFQSQRD